MSGQDVAEPLDGPIPPDRRSPRLTLAVPDTWVEVSDDTGQIGTQVPVAWSNVWGNGWHVSGFPGFEGRIGPGLNAGPDVGAWWDDPRVPGLFVGASTQLVQRYQPASAARRLRFRDCSVIASAEIAFGCYRGHYLEWEGTMPLHNWICLAATPSDRGHLLLVQAKDRPW